MAGLTVTSAFSDSLSNQRLVFHAGALDRLADEVALLQMKRPVLCTSRTYVLNGVAERVSKAMSLAATFGDVRPHVPEEVVERLLEIARRSNADGVIAVGGGSVIGTAKAVAAQLSEESGSRPVFPIVAVPTTYAGSEMTPVYGVTRGHQKETRTDLRVLPCLVIYDPALTVDLSPQLTAGTAMNALAHSVEAVYSLRSTPLARAAALAATVEIREALPALMLDGRDASARTCMLTAAHLAGFALAHAGMALHHVICHALGAGGVPHGTANAIMLSHVMRFNLPACVPQLAAVARALQPDLAGSEHRTAAFAPDSVEALAAGLPLPRRLSEVGVDLSRLPEIANHAFESSAAACNPHKLSSAADVEHILHTAW